MAFDFPKVIALPPVPCSWRMKRTKKTKRKTTGIHWPRMVSQRLFCSSFSYFTSTPDSRSFWSITASAGGPMVRNRSLLSSKVPEYELPRTLTWRTFFSSIFDRSAVNVGSWTSSWLRLKMWKKHTNRAIRITQSPMVL